MSAPVKAERRERFEVVVGDEDGEGGFWDEFTQRMTCPVRPESASEICRSKDIPYGALRGWLEADEGRLERWRRLLEARADVLADQVVEIADQVEEDPASRRVRVEARKWLASKHGARTYGEKLDVRHEGGVPMLNVVVVGVAEAAIRAPVEGVVIRAPVALEHKDD